MLSLNGALKKEPEQESLNIALLELYWKTQNTLRKTKDRIVFRRGEKKAKKKDNHFGRDKKKKENKNILVHALLSTT
jgi:hypothetical protein